MKKRREEEVGLLVRKYLRDYGLETPLNEYRIIQAWPLVAGAAIARYTGDLQIRNSILYVQIRSAALRENLNHQRTLLASRLNEVVGSRVITELRFY